DAAAQDADGEASTAMSLLKGILDVLYDADGVAAFPEPAAPANGVSLAEVIHAIYDDTHELQSDDIPTTLTTLTDDAEEAHERSFERKYPFVTTNQSVSSASEESLTAPATVTPTFPTAATRLNSWVVAILKVNNQTAAEHNIGVTLQKNIAAGGWEDVRDFTASPPLTLPAVDATADSITFIEPVSVTTGQSVQFRFQVDSDNAGEVHYTQAFFFTVEYDFQ
ncbi:unnamed protein product, partial [marine sediment metagenome]